MAGRCEVKVTDCIFQDYYCLPSLIFALLREWGKERAKLYVLVNCVCLTIFFFSKLWNSAQSWCHCVAVPKYNSISCFHFPPPSIQKWQPVTSSDAADSRRSAPITAQCSATRLGLHQSEASSQAEGPWRHGLYFPVATAPAMAMVSWEDWRLTVLRTDWHWQPGYWGWGPARLWADIKQTDFIVTFWRSWSQIAFQRKPTL